MTAGGGLCGGAPAQHVVLRLRTDWGRLALRLDVHQRRVGTYSEMAYSHPYVRC